MLGVTVSASTEEIQTAFRKMARTMHPDVSKKPDAIDHFLKLREAYDVLRDPQRRELYDLRRKHTRTRDHSPPHKTQHKHSEFEERLRQEQKRPAQSGTDVVLKISFNDAYQGTTASLMVEWPQPGGITELKKVRVQVPKGTSTGDKLRILDGKITVQIQVDPDERFQLVGQDVLTQITVAAWDAALGTKLTVDTPLESIALTVPPGTSSGQKLRIKGHGLPAKTASGTPGDFYAIVQIRVPKNIDKKSRELWQRLRELGADEV